MILKRNQNKKQIDDAIGVPLKGTINSEKYQGDARDILNKKRMVDEQLVVSNSEQNRTHTQLMLLEVILLSKQ